MNYEEVKKMYPDLKEIPVLEMEVTFAEDYFVKYDHLLLNFPELVAISRSYKDENGNYKLILRPVGENPSAILNPYTPLPQMHEFYEGAETYADLWENKKETKIENKDEF